MSRIIRPSNYWVIKEVNIKNDGGRRRLFMIDLANIPYHQGRSFSWFFFSKKYRNWKPSYKQQEFLYTTESIHEWKMMHKSTNESLAKYGIKPQEYEVISVKDVHEFFSIIGWNYKKQKYEQS